MILAYLRFLYEIHPWCPFKDTQFKIRIFSTSTHHTFPQKREHTNSRQTPKRAVHTVSVIMPEEHTVVLHTRIQKQKVKTSTKRKFKINEDITTFIHGATVRRLLFGLDSLITFSFPLSLLQANI